MGSSQSVLRRGRAARRSWTLLRDHGVDPLVPTVCDRVGEILHRDPVGFPGTLTLRDPEGALGPAGALRAMKAASLAVRAAQPEGGTTIQHIELVCHPASPPPRAEVDPTTGRLCFWIGDLAGLDAAAVRRALGAAVRDAERVSLPRPAEHGEKRREALPPKVLLLQNPFDRESVSEDALHVNPGMHHLITPLQRAGCDVVLLESKIPFQDVCANPPPLGSELPPGGFISDPAEIDRALAEHPDLDLVCLTLLERCFDQIQQLCRYIRERSNAFIAVGGAFPTATPEHAFVHLPEANFVVRGEGDDIVAELARVVSGRAAGSGLDDAGIEHLLGLEGLLARVGTTSIASPIWTKPHWTSVFLPKVTSNTV